MQFIVIRISIFPKNCIKNCADQEQFELPWLRATKQMECDPHRKQQISFFLQTASMMWCHLYLA